MLAAVRFSSRRLPRHDTIMEPTRPLESGGYQGARPAEARRLREFSVRRLPNPASRAVGRGFDWPGTLKNLSPRLINFPDNLHGVLLRGIYETGRR